LQSAKKLIVSLRRVFPPEFQALVIITNFRRKEMFEISEEIRLDFAPRASNNRQELVLLPVDPDHLYAYWNLGDDKPNASQPNDSDNQLTLRIYSEPKKNMAITKTKSWFDVDIESAQAQQKIFLPSRTPEAAYSANNRQTLSR